VSVLDYAKALITGVAGFIGSFLAEKLLDEDYYVVGVDNLFRGKMENISHLLKHPRFQFIKHDITKPLDQINHSILKDVDIIYHYAAINGTKYFYEIPLDVLRVNVKGTMNILEYATKIGVKKIVFASSSEVYGEPLYYPTDEDHPIILPEVNNPRYSYAASKVIGEYYIVWYSKTYGIKYLILRIFNTYGPRMDTSEYGQVIPEFIRKVLLEKEFTMIAPGTQTRSFCYIDDNIEFTIRAVKKVNNDILNIGNDEEVRIIDLAKLIHEILGKDFKYKLLPPRPGDPMRRLPNIEKAIRLTGYKPQVPLREGIKRTIKWYVKKWGLNIELR